MKRYLMRGQANFVVLGTHAYSVFDKDNKIIWSDYCDMWDTEACIDNACQDVDSLG